MKKNQRIRSKYWQITYNEIPDYLREDALDRLIKCFYNRWKKRNTISYIHL